MCTYCQFKYHVILRYSFGWCYYYGGGDFGYHGIQV